MTAGPGTAPAGAPVAGSVLAKRILVVDDSVVIRQLVGEAVASDPQLVLAGTAPNGRIALDKLGRLAVDAVVLDVEMPVLDGLATLVELRRSWPRLPVLMFSTLTGSGAATTIKALTLGASDYALKPAAGGLEATRGALRQELVSKLHALLGITAAAVLPQPRAQRGEAPPRRRAEGAQRVTGVVIACSTGGPNALAELVGALPATLAVPVVVVQHMPPTFTALLAGRLDQMTPLGVREAADGDAVRAGEILIAPGGHHLRLASAPDGVRAVLDDGAPEQGVRPAADVLFRSAAKLWGPATLAVVLTGMGADGLDGSRHVVAAGGRVLAQDEASSVVWGMPGQVVREQLVEEQGTPAELAAAVARRVALRPSGGRPVAAR